MRHPSPLRYPGGKACLTSFLSGVISANHLSGGDYFEPYAGGAGAALGLLSDGVVANLFLNDADKRIQAFWKSVLNSSQQFIDRIHEIPLTMPEWYRQRSICANPGGYSEFQVGFAAFYMNRCNRSGVINGAGPIGGYEQAGFWKLGVRFNRDNLVERVQYLAAMKGRISISGEDAIIFLRQKLPKGRQRSGVFVYLDPPYVVKGQRLYMNAYSDGDHALLAKYIHAQKKLRWLMSYDDSTLVRELYSRHNIATMKIKYTLQEKRLANELIIAPSHLTIPKSNDFIDIEHIVNSPLVEQGVS